MISSWAAQRAVEHWTQVQLGPCSEIFIMELVLGWARLAHLVVSFGSDRL